MWFHRRRKSLSGCSAVFVHTVREDTLEFYRSIITQHGSATIPVDIVKSKKKYTTEGKSSGIEWKKIDVERDQ